MAKTFFSGPVESGNGFKSVVKNETTGAITEISTYGGAPVALADGNVSLTNATHSGRILIVPNGAADGTDFIVNTGSNTNFFIGNVAFNDTDDGAASVVFSDGNSNSKLQVNVPASAVINVVAKDGTNWQVWGSVTGATAPAFADQ
jgi:hypothetical protein